uniref:Phospholipase A2 inhibitor and Ly6/PLAUR domain-containing protein-like isoform X2 n=1 Tax=Pogona vitticeps TaxID=103695 RepID=A0ABM5ES98_9SAUR
MFPFLAWFDPSSSTMKPFPNSWLLLSLHSSGVSLQCQFCQDTSATSTTETTQECQSSQDVYVSAVSEVSMNGLRVSLSFKSCLDHWFCQAGSYTASVEDDVHIRTQINCCQEGQCNRGALQLPDPKKLVANGFQCPGCFSILSDRCGSKGMVNCTQKEDPCFNLAGSINRSILNGRSAFQGCTTAKACSFKREAVKAANQVFEAQISQADCKPEEKVTPPPQKL